jgi:hypothetical protein
LPKRFAGARGRVYEDKVSTTHSHCAKDYCKPDRSTSARNASVLPPSHAAAQPALSYIYVTDRQSRVNIAASHQRKKKQKSSKILYQFRPSSKQRFVKKKKLPARASPACTPRQHRPSFSTLRHLSPAIRQ